MTIKDFKPNGSTGPNNNDVLFEDYYTGPTGARFILLREKHHTDDDIKKAKSYLYNTRDVVSIKIISE